MAEQHTGKTFTQAELDAAVAAAMQAGAEAAAKAAASVHPTPATPVQTGLFAGWSPVHNGITAVVAAGLTAAGMYFFGSSSESEAE